MTPGGPWGQSQSERSVGKWALKRLGDTDPLNLDNNTAQRKLVDTGRDQARAIGAAFKKLGIPGGRVVASQFARAELAARLLDIGEGEIVVFHPLGDGKFELFGRVAPPATWSEWAR